MQNRGAAAWVYPFAKFDLDFQNGRYSGGNVGLGVNTSNRREGCIDGQTTPSTRFTPTRSGILIPATGNANRVTDGYGLWAEGTTVNSCLWNRDLTNAVWTAIGITAAKNQTGANGVANAASSLTATAPNGTIMQIITLASANSIFSAYVKRITGTGSIFITQDAGVTYTDITSQVNTAGYYTYFAQRPFTPAATVLNPTVGFKIATSGDVIAVDFCQQEALSAPSCPVATTTVAVNVSSNEEPIIGTITSHDNDGIRIFRDVIQSGGAWSMLWQGCGSPRSSGYEVVGVIAGSGLDMHGGCDGGVCNIAGNNTANSGNAGIFNLNKMAFRTNGTGTRGCMNGGALTTNSTLLKPTPPPAAGAEHCGLGNNGAGTGPGPLDGFITRVTFFPFELTDGQMQEYTR